MSGRKKDRPKPKFPKYCCRCATKKLATGFGADIVRETKTGVLCLFDADRWRNSVSESLKIQEIKHTCKAGHHLFISSDPCDKIHTPDEEVQ